MNQWLAIRLLFRLFDINLTDIAIYSVEVGDIRRGVAESDIIRRDRINPISVKLILNNCFILYLFPRTQNAAVKPPPVSTSHNKNTEPDAPYMWRQWLICTIWRQMVCQTADTPVLKCYSISNNAIYPIPSTGVNRDMRGNSGQRVAVFLKFL